VLGSIGYRTTGKANCGNRRGMSRIATSGVNYPICVYESKIKDGYFNYGVVTYIYMDIPVIGGTFKIPVYSESERIFKFSK
jgi:hypothetical protein